MANSEHLIWCGTDKPPKKPVDGTLVHLSTDGPNENVNCRIENISNKLTQNLSPIIEDMIEIGSYVYAADQTVSRGGPAWSNNGADWTRDFRFVIPVREPDTWNKQEVRESLEELLSFMSGDSYQFEFTERKSIRATTPYFEFGDNPWFRADSIVLFSGGLDSFAGALEEVLTLRNKTVLVSHRSVPKIAKRQLDLAEKVRQLAGGNQKLLHVPVWVNKVKGLTKDSTQRSRSFLFMMLAASMGEVFKSNTIRFYENGITSFNLPCSAQVVDSRASRTTHPKTLKLASEFFTKLLNRQFVVTNPFLWHTKTDVVGVIKKHNLGSLVPFTSSCSHTQTTSIMNTHCGTCSQCFDRRTAIIAGGLADFETGESYKVNLPLDPIKEGRDRTMVESMARMATEIEDMDEVQFCSKLNEIERIVTNLDPPVDQAAMQVISLYKRHSAQVFSVLRSFVSENATLILKKRVPPDSLLSMIAGLIQPSAKAEDSQTICKLPDGTTWSQLLVEIVSNDAIRIKANGFTKRLTYQDLGMRDGRKGDFPTAQWELLIEFAEGGGMLNWKSKGSDPKWKKQVNVLRKKLKDIFGLSGAPITMYQKRVGYKCNFQVSDSRPNQVRKKIDYTNPEFS